MELIMGLVLGVALPILFVLPIPFMKRFLAWAGRNFLLIMSDQWGTLRLLATLYGIALICLLSIAIHELGHLLAGLATGFHCESFRAGRFVVSKDFKISRYRNLADERVGWADMVPIRWEGLRARYAVMVLSGPLANLLSAYVTIHFWKTQSLISGAFIGVSIFLGLTNLIPGGQRKAYLNDGERLRMLLFDTKRSDRFLAMLEVRYKIKSEESLALLEPKIFDRLSSVSDTSLQAAQAYILAYMGARAHGEYSRSEDFLEAAWRASGDTSPRFREVLSLYSAQVQARRQRLDLAEQWLAAVPEKTMLPELRASLDELISKHNAGLFANATSGP
jgi:hypothetical protein